uniref:Tetraspanin n=1 Tax=Schistocephalus solidus TaxID=70667 RepID=A0A0X3PPP5_SCHSO
MSILLLLEVVAAFLLFAFRVKCKEFVESSLKKTIDRIINGPANSDDVAAMDFMQQKFQCCGATSPADWGSHMPSSCCKNAAAPCPDNHYTVSCGDAFYEVIKDSWLYLGIVIIIIAVLEVGAIASACILQSKINTYESV